MISNLKYRFKVFFIGILIIPTISHSQDVEKWENLKFSGIKKNEYVINEDGVIDILMDDSSSLLYRKISDREKETSLLSWQWKITEGFPATSMANSDEDDRPVAVHIWFPKEKSDKNKGLKEFFGRLFGYDFPGRVITYVWGGTENERDFLENPHFKERGFIIIQKSGLFESDDWIEEQVNFREDYEKIFNEQAPNPTHVAISGDSDHSHVTAKSSVQMIKFSGTVETTPNTAANMESNE